MSLLRFLAKQLVPRPGGPVTVQPVRAFSVSPASAAQEITNGFGPWDQKQAVVGSGALHGWPKHNEKIWAPDGTYRPAFVCHVRDNIKYQQKKMWWLAQFVRGLSVDEAIKQLQFINKKGAFVAAEVIEEAREMAVKEHCVEFGTNLWVAESFATKAMRIQGVRRHGRGRMAAISYDYMHYYVRLEEGKPPKDYWGAYNRGFAPEKMLEEWVQAHRLKTPRC